MKRIEISGQVASFIRGRAPEPRRRLRLALRQLSRERGEIKPLEGRLKDYFRLRVGDYRIVFRYSASGKTIQCIFAERRHLVYDLFERLLHARLLGRKN
jgi:mRNA-degrading endonuclease RelE of RelBE toxin-antitoxin system